VLKHRQIDGGGEAVEDGRASKAHDTAHTVSHCLTLGRHDESQIS